MKILLLITVVVGFNLSVNAQSLGKISHTTLQQKSITNVKGENKHTFNVIYKDDSQRILITKDLLAEIESMRRQSERVYLRVNPNAEIEILAKDEL